jgi:transketolase
MSGIECKTKSILDYKKSAFNIRKRIMNACICHGDGHAGPSLSCTDLLAGLYLEKLNHRLVTGSKIDYDKFLLSAGHKCLALYSTLIEVGYESEEVMDTYNQLYTKIPGHPYADKFDGIDFNFGSLGHGLPVGIGMATGMKIKGIDRNVYVLMGDGEHGEGSVWESVSYAAHANIDNLIAIIDRNGLQINGTTEEVHSTTSLEERYRAFGWHVIVIDGHDFEEILAAYDEATLFCGKPVAIIANTIKSKGMTWAEGDVNYHHWNPGPEECKRATSMMEEQEWRLYNGKI